MKRRTGLSKIIPMSSQFQVHQDNGCFMLSEHDPEVAKMDLKCYKIIGVANKNPRLTYGPYTGENYGYIGKDSVLTPKDDIRQNFWRRMVGIKDFDAPMKYSGLWKVGPGWIHVTWIKPGIESLPHPGTYELWECIIPEGTEFYRSETRASHYESASIYASKKIIFKKLLRRANLDK